MESRHDSENAERILYNMRPKELVEVIKKAYLQGEVEFEDSDDDDDGDGKEDEDGEDHAASPRNVGHNIYILAHQLARHNKELQHMLKPGGQNGEGDEALEFYAKHTAQIEVADLLCDFRIRPNTEICILMYFPHPRHPYKTQSCSCTLEPRLSALLWVAMFVSLAIVIVLPQPHGIRALIASTILRLIFSVGLEPTLFLLGAFNVCNKVIFLMSFVGNRGTFTRGYLAMILDVEFLYHLLYLIICSLGVFVHVFFYSLLLFDLVYREETLLNVIKSVTRNGRSIVLTAVLALILVYLFSIVGYIFFKDDFILEVDRIPNKTLGKEQLAGSVLLSQLGHGCSEPLFAARVIYDLLFFFMVIIIVLNLIFGVIIDTFADLRSEKQKKEEVLKTTCFICGLERDKFDNKTVTFEEHIKVEHNMWHYLCFIVLVKVKDSTEYTGPESYVAEMIKELNLDWFPRMRAMSLVSSDAEGEQNEIRNLQEKLESTMKLVCNLSGQLTELKDQVCSGRPPLKLNIEQLRGHTCNSSENNKKRNA
ncbi:Inositol 1,4,5-trisphosphate receptor type 1 [Acipenser ruthenus]|uniref:Inositol 1,4,5-trisphosphate receptor type 1 n=1 Tax=Acipenser ruthenus TaxID=7906 RepID=A0A444V486_ACIRT|nr:Inositol 1,4,5-trisphosphate receptor type 1 [Acipenser ruthenus]